MLDLDYLLPAPLTGYIREVPWPATYTLNQFLPDVTIQDIEAAWDVLTRTNRAAKYRSWDAETPVGMRDSFERKRISLPPIGQKTVLGEYERLTLERVRAGGDNRNRMVEAIYNDADINTRAVHARVELARGDVLTDGKFTLTGENGLTLEADFGVDGTHIVSAGTAWSDHTNSDPLADMRTWADVYTNDAGEPPAYAIMSRTVIGHVLRNAQVRSLVSSLAGTPNIVTRQQLDTVLQAYDLPRIVEYNTSIDVDGTATRPIPNDRVVFTPADASTLGATIWGITAEALELVGGAQPQLEFEEAPGLIGVVLREGDPVRRWTKVGAVAMPVIRDPRRLLVADVM